MLVKVFEGGIPNINPRKWRAYFLEYLYTRMIKFDTFCQNDSDTYKYLHLVWVQMTDIAGYDQNKGIHLHKPEYHYLSPSPLFLTQLYFSQIEIISSLIFFILFFSLSHPFAILDNTPVIKYKTKRFVFLPLTLALSLSLPSFLLPSLSLPPFLPIFLPFLLVN
uniref:Uncharacterized protein n=1 Tax=Cacopsylla melanoneura TaxID=428564 RepID=A0A8D8RMU2_9HEMI